MGMSVIPVLMIVGGLNLSRIIGWQADQAGWFFTPRCPFLYSWWPLLRKTTGCRLICRRRKRIGGGYHTEYSSMKFALFFLEKAPSLGSLNTKAVRDCGRPLCVYSENRSAEDGVR